MLRPDRERGLFPIDAIETIDWSDVNIKRESQGADRDPATIQHRTIQALSTEDEWEIVIDDDGAGELADIVLLKRTEDALEVLMVHCKYSSGDKPGARIDDLYDVCGQSMKRIALSRSQSCSPNGSSSESSSARALERAA